MNKSELKRKCIQNPLEMAEELDRIARLCEAKDTEYKENFDALKNVLHDTQKQLSEANAIIAMQADSLNRIASEDVGLAKCISIAYKAISATSETIAAWRTKDTESLRREITRLAKAEVDLEVKLHDAQNEAINEVIDYIEKNCQLYAGQDIADILRAAKWSEESNSMRIITELRREVAMLNQALIYVSNYVVFDSDGELRTIVANAINDTKETALAYERSVMAKALEDAKRRIYAGEFDPLCAEDALQEMAHQYRATNKGEVKWPTR